MDKETELRKWRNLADKDIAAARHMADSMWPAPYEIVCFHCQQSAEKYLKWVLVLHDIDPPKVHDLEELEKLCETINPQFGTLYEKCAALTEYAVHSRYPDENQLEKDDMDRALEYAQTIKDFIYGTFPGYLSMNPGEAEPQKDV